MWVSLERHLTQRERVITTINDCPFEPVMSSMGAVVRPGQAIGWMREVECVYMELLPFGGEKDHQVRPHM